MIARTHEPMLIAHYIDSPTGAEAWLVVDTFLHGVAGGGVRMAPDVDEQLVCDLAATMSEKVSVVQPPLGGAKCGIRFDPRARESKDVLNRVVHAFAPFLRTCWVTGSDLGTDWQDIVSACHNGAGIPHPQYALMKAYGGEKDEVVKAGIERLGVGTSILVNEACGITMSNAVTGWTVCAATIEALEHKGESIVGKRVAIQGFGAVGGSAALFLSQAGASIVAISDEVGAVLARDEKGLDVARLLNCRMKPANKVLDRARVESQFGYESADRDEVLYIPSDILVPAAGSHLTIDLDRVKASLVVEGANDPLTDEQENELFRRGITVIPDAIANAGNAGLFGLLVAGHIPITKEAILAFLSEQVRLMTRKVLELPSSAPREALKKVTRTQIHNRIKAGHSVLPNGLTPKDLDALQSDHLTIKYTMTSPYEIIGASLKERVA